MKKQTLFTGAFIYLLTAVVAYFFFTKVYIVGNSIISAPVPEAKKEGDLTVFDDSLPKTEECPLNGALYSKQQRQWWEKHRPLGVMIENHEDARPQSGISGSDVVYEAIAEGGITRFLVLFYCQDAGQVGPIRSARTYFLDFVSEYGDYPLYVHVGGANTPGPANALGQIEDYGWQSYNDMNQFSIGFPTFWRDYDRLGRVVATEHTMYSTTSKLWDYAAKTRKLSEKNEDGDRWDADFVSYAFKDGIPNKTSTQVINFNFWDGYDTYGVTWTYDPTTNTYLRKNGGVAHKDRDNNKQLSTSNVVILYMKESRANDGYEGNLHMIYGTKGSGKAVVYQDGKEIDANWSKKSRTDRLLFTDSAGKPIEFSRGRIWFEVVSPDTDVVAK